MYKIKRSDGVLYQKESFKIMGACFEVYTQLGNGFLENVYQECLKKELIGLNIPFIEKPQLEIFYNDEILDQKYEPDFLCFDKIILEIKANRTLAEEHKAQVINYLKATDLKLGLLINFGHYPKIQYERLVN